MKKTSRILAIVLALVMVLSVSAFAQWEQYQGDDEHNGQITDGAPYTTSGSLGTHLDEIQLGSGGWSGIDSEPLMVTEGSTTYAYVTYNGGAVSGNNGGTRLAKIDCSSPNSAFLDEDNNYNPQLRIIWSIQLTQSATFQLSTPCYYNGQIYVAGSGLSQLLQNNELVKSNNSYSHWTVTGGTQNDGYVTIIGNDSATFISDFVDITGGYNHRPAMGIRLGSTAPSTTKATITVNALDASDNSVFLGTYVFSPSATDASYRPILSLEDGYYYYYLNHNVASSLNANLTSGSYKIKFVVTISNSDSASNTVDIEYCSFYEQNSTVFEVTNLTSSTAPSVTAVAKIGTNGGQINTPISCYDYTSGSKLHQCIYFGTYSGTHSYYQYDITDNVVTEFTPDSTNGGFYWAGAYSDGIGVAFGGDNGYLYYTTVAAFGGNATQEYSLNTLGGITNAGNVRSSLCKYGDYVYFTSQGGYLWKVYWPNIANLSSSDVSKIKLSGNSSTSTPVISSNEYIYVGTYGSSTYSDNGVRAYPVNNFSASAVIDIVSGSGSGNNGDKCAVQCSVIVYSPDTTLDYVFYTTNQSGGKGYCVKHTIANHSVTEQWNTGSGNFTLQGMSATNGYLTFGNDGHSFYVIKQ